MGFTLFVPDESVRTPSRWIVAYTSAPNSEMNNRLTTSSYDDTHHIANYSDYCEGLIYCG